jgi:hypothetical protein
MLGVWSQVSHDSDALCWADLGLTVPTNFGRLRSFEHFTGTRVTVLEGVGTIEDRYRTVTYWLDEHGNLILKRDPVDLDEPPEATP